MKYWIFQNNQVLGPYAPEDLGRLPSFGPESLVCPEGRKGTSMGDWQRAGMVPDLSVSLIKASQAQSVRTPVATLGGFPPEPTLKDLAVLGSLQEKMSMLEDVVLQLQEGLRVKDAELAGLHAELAGKAQESSDIRKDAEQFRRETDLRRREAEALKSEAEEFKRKISDLEERVSSVNRLSETIDKAVEAEKHVEHDVEAHGATISELTHEIEALREQIHGRLGAAAAPAVPVDFKPIAPNLEPAPAPSIAPLPTLAVELPPAPAVEPSPVAEPPKPSFPAQDLPAPTQDLPEIAPFSSAKTLPSFDATAPVPSFSPAETPEPAPSPASSLPEALPFNPLSTAEAPAVAAPPPLTVPPPPASGRKRAVLLGSLFGLAALGGLAVFSGRVPGLPGLSKPKIPANLTEPAPLPTPEPTPPPEPAVDERAASIDFAKEWTLKSGVSLGQTLQTLSPSNGNLSPWMAEPLSTGRVQVNYFARGSGAGSPTVAYEFEVDLVNKNLIGRNAAAKAVIAGKTLTPPAPPKPKPVKVKAKPPVQEKPKVEESLDSLLDGPPAPAVKPEPHKPAAPAEKKEPTPEAKKAEENATLETLLSPAEPPTARPSHAKRAAKAAKGGKKPEGKAEDASLLDDLLKE